MRFVYDLTVPADTSQAAPVESEVKLITGTIRRVAIAFPPGCFDMVDVIIKEELMQISPANQGASHHWDNYTEVFDLEYPLTSPEPVIQLVGWSPGTKFQHVITFRFDVTPAGGDDREALINLLMGAGGFSPYSVPAG